METSSDESKQTKQATSKKGGLKTMPFIIANETLEKVAGVGLQPNMVLYLIEQYHFSGAASTNIIFLWSAVSHFMPTLGAFLSDSYMGRFSVIAYASVISFFGLILMWLTALLRVARPPECNPYIETCQSPNSGQLLLLFSSFVLMSIGAGGIRTCSLAFGADQFDNPENPKNERNLQIFFNWYYASVTTSIMIAVTAIVYLQTAAGWVIGFGVPAGLMLVSVVMFLLGSSLYVKLKPKKSLFIGFVRVTVASWKKRKVVLPPKSCDGNYYHPGSKADAPTERLRFLNKACLITNPDKDLDSDGLAIDPRNLCTVQQVEELKALIKVLAIWSTGIMPAVTISQQTFPVLQAKTLDRRFIGDWKIPAASFSVFGLLTLTIWVAIYDRILVPYLAKLTKQPRGLSFKQRMGIGLAISCIATAVAGIVERKRRNIAILEGYLNNPNAVIGMSSMWIVPQHCLTGLAEAFNAIGQLEFYYSQFPKSMATIAVALLSLGFAVGNLVGSLVVTIINHSSKKGGHVSWVPTNVNKGHYDYYYWILTGMSVINFFYYLGCSWAYGSCDDGNVWDEDGTEGEELQKSGKDDSMSLHV